MKIVTPFTHNFKQLEELLKLIYGTVNPNHITHIELTVTYALKLLSKFPNLNRYCGKIKYAALAHDLLKGKHFNTSEGDPIIMGFSIPQDLNRYVRLNLEILEPYELDAYFNTDIQLHALAAGIFLIKELGITDTQILYPVFFHSCPILALYKQLDDTTKLFVDIMVLADKLSSNKLNNDKANGHSLHLTVFGESGYEFNFTLGLYLARLIGQGASKEENSKLMTEHYYHRMVKLNPILRKEKCPHSVKWKKENKNGKEGNNTG